MLGQTWHTRILRGEQEALQLTLATPELGLQESWGSSLLQKGTCLPEITQQVMGQN